MFKKITICLIIGLCMNKIIAQDFKYSFVSSLKAYQEIDNKGNVIDSSLWETTDVKVTITKEKCIVIENGIVNEFQVLSNELKKDNLTRIEIKAIKNKIKYDIELVLINNGEFLFLVKNNRIIKLYRFNKLNKLPL